jgi:hypothetical protein
MLGVLVLGFCGFLSFCVGVCGFLRRLVDCGYFGFVLVPTCREERCVYLRVFLLGVSLRCGVARRFLNWISALHT